MTADWEERSQAAWRGHGYAPAADWLCPSCQHAVLVRGAGDCTWHVVCDWCLRGAIECVIAPVPPVPMVQRRQRGQRGRR